MYRSVFFCLFGGVLWIMGGDFVVFVGNKGVFKFGFCEGGLFWGFCWGVLCLVFIEFVILFLCFIVCEIF